MTLERVRDVLTVIGAVMPIIQVVANWVSPSTRAGRILHFVAGNGTRIQAAIRALESDEAE